MNSSKEHFYLLDGMRAVAALMVLLYHLFEAVAFAAGAPEQKMFHGFLAVDFFLILSGFVMGFAYDSRWDKMSVGAFFKRRLIRLHPMVIMGVAIGLVAFIGQGCLNWDGEKVSTGAIITSTVLALFLLPSPLSLDVRGNTEMFPLNGPHWSLFFEYIGNILYALALRKLPTKALKVWVVFIGLALMANGIWGPDGSIACGWSSQPMNMLGGLLRMCFDYSVGLLLIRIFQDKKPSSLGKLTFPLCSLALIGLLCVPSLKGGKVFYEMLCVAALFPILIWICARGLVATEKTKKTMSFLGGFSYTLYAVHYPFIYLYIGWINSGAKPFGPYQWCSPVAVAVISIVTGIVCLVLYDIPIRKWLVEKLQ